MKGYIVDQTALTENINLIKAKAGNTPIYAVIKGNGYGLGLIQFATLLRENGITRFAVTEVPDIQALRDAGFVDEEILMLRATCLPDELDCILKLHAVATVANMECAVRMNEIAKTQHTVFPCHLKIDTGMGRYGFEADDIDGLTEVFALGNLKIEGIYTHFHSSFCNEEATKKQYAAFKSSCDTLIAKGCDIGTRHCCNSSAFIKYPEMYMDAVRVGSAFLGRLSFPGDYGLKRIGYCEGQIEVIRNIPAGRSVGYGSAWTAAHETKIAVIGIGYYHGFGTASGNDLFRFRDCVRNGLHEAKNWLQHKAIYVSVNGHSARVLGHIGMVQTIIDITDIPCEIGDPVIFEINPLIHKGLDIIYR